MIKHLMPFIIIAAFCSCQKDSNEVIPTEEEIRLGLIPAATKKPYYRLTDDALEAELIAQGYDSDNQLNGKISVEDAEKVDVFGGYPFSLFPLGTPERKQDSIRLSGRHEKMEFLKKEYKAANGGELIIKDLSDISFLKNLRRIYFNAPIAPTNIIDSVSFTDNPHLEEFRIVESQIKVVNFNGCHKLKKIQFFYNSHPRYATLLEKVYLNDCPSLEWLQYNGTPKTLDVSQNKELTFLQIDYRGFPDESVEALNLCNNLKMKSLRIFISQFKNVYLSNPVFEKYENEKKDYIDSYAAWRLENSNVLRCE